MSKTQPRQTGQGPTCLPTFDLVVQGDHRVRDTLSFRSVQDPPSDRESHDVEHRLEDEEQGGGCHVLEPQKPPSCPSHRHSAPLPTLPSPGAPCQPAPCQLTHPQPLPTSCLPLGLCVWGLLTCEGQGLALCTQQGSSHPDLGFLHAFPTRGFHTSCSLSLDFLPHLQRTGERPPLLVLQV